MDDPLRASAGWVARLWSRLGERPPLQAGIVAAAAAAAGLIVVEFVVLVVWVADTRSTVSAATALRVGADLWVLAHGASLHLPAGEVDVLPLGLAAVPVVLGASTGHRLAVSSVQSAPAVAEPPDTDGSPRQLWRSATYRTTVGTGRASGSGRGALAGPGLAASGPPRPRHGSVPWAAISRDVPIVLLPYAAVVGIVTALASDPAARPSLAEAMIGTAVLVGCGATVGALRGRAGLGALWWSLPAWLRTVATAGSGAAAMAVGLASLAVATLLAARLPEAASAAGDLDAGVVGGVGLFAAQAVLLPNVVLWGVAYALGPGFATGGDGLVSPSQVRPGPLPDLPVFAVLPDVPLPGSGRFVLAVLPVAAGCVLAVLARRARSGEPFAARLAQVAAAAGACGMLLALGAYLSGGQAGPAGPAGPGRFGPPVQWTGLLAAAEIGVVAVAATVVAELARLGQRRARGAKTARSWLLGAAGGPRQVAEPAGAGEAQAASERTSSRTASPKRWRQISSSWLVRASRRQS